MLGVCLLPAFTRLGHECQDLLESVRWNVCVHRLDLGLYSHQKRVLGEMESEPMLTPRAKIPSTRKILPRGGSNPRRCIKQGSDPDTLPTSYFGARPNPYIYTSQLRNGAHMDIYELAPCFKRSSGPSQKRVTEMAIK